MSSIFLFIFLLQFIVSSSASADTYIRQIGRLQQPLANKYENDGNISTVYVSLRGDWPGSGIQFNVIPQSSSSSSSAIDIQVKYASFEDCNCKYFIKVLLDGEQYLSKEVSAQAGFDVAVSLPFTSSSLQKKLQFLKQTEAACSDASGVMEIKSVSLSGGGFVDPLPADNKMNILFVGDSITAAYGVDGEMPCSFTAATENVFDGYAGIVSKYFDANAQFIAWSGKGVVRNYGDANQVSNSPMPVYYNRTIAEESSSDYYNPSEFQANIVYLMLGTNDYSTDPVPEDNVFVNGLMNLMNQIAIDYPNSKLIVACAPMQRGNQCKNIEAGVANYNQLKTALASSYLFLDSSLNDGGYGCDYHPNKISAQNIANVVIAKINEVLL